MHWYRTASVLSAEDVSKHVPRACDIYGRLILDALYVTTLLQLVSFQLSSSPSRSSLKLASCKLPGTSFNVTFIHGNTNPCHPTGSRQLNRMDVRVDGLSLEEVDI